MGRPEALLEPVEALVSLRHLLPAGPPPSSRSPRPCLLRPRLAEQFGHGHAERAGNLGQGPDRQVLPAALDALQVFQREAKALRLLLLGEPSPKSRASRTTHTLKTGCHVGCTF